MTKFLNNADVKGYVAQTAVTSSLLKTDSNGKLVAAVAGTDYNAPNATAVAGTLVREIRNTTGATLTKGTVVYISGATGNKATVSKAIATGDSTSAQTFGLCQTDIANNSNGNVVVIGDIAGLDTSAFTEGVQLYLSSTTAGTYTSTKQLAPAHLVYIGVVTRSHPTQGQIEVKIQNGYELDEIHDVAISSLANNHTIVWESATSLWKNKTIAAALGYTPADDSNVVKLTGDQTVAGVKTFTSVVNAPTLSLNGGVLAGNNIVSMRSNPTGGQFRIEKSDGSLSAYPFYIGVDGTALAYYYNASGALKVLLHTDNTSYFGNSLSVGYSTYATTSYMLDVNGTSRFTNTVTIGNFDTLALRMQAGTSTGSSYLRFFNSAGTARGYFGLFWSGTSDYMVLDAGALEMNFGSSNKFTFTGGGTAQFSGALTTAGDVTISTGSIKMYSVQNAAGQYRYIGTEYAAGNGNNKAEIRFGIDGSDTRTKITLHTANGGGQINEVLGVFASGQFKLNNYTSSTSFSGTAAGYLAFDSSGNVITVAGVAATDNTKLPLAGGTMTGQLVIGTTGVANSPSVRINTSSSATFIHTQENFAANITAGQHAMIFIGRDGSTKNAGGFGYYWAGAGSNSNFITMGHWGNDDLFRVYGDGLVMATTNFVVGSQQGFDNPGGWNKNVLIDATNHGRFRIKASNYTYGNIETYLWADSSVSPSHGIYGSNAVFSFGGSITSLTVGGQTVIHTGNIGSQSVSYASTAGTASNITAYTINQSVGTGNSPSFAEAIFGTTGGATNQGIQIRYQNYVSGYGRIRFYQSDSNHATIHVFSSSWQNGSLASSSTGAINLDSGTGITFGPWNNPDAYIATGGAGWFRTSVTAQNYFYASGSIRLGDMWNSTGGLYRPSGIMCFGTENEGWRFSMANSQKAYIGTDGNLWMAWSGEYLSTTLDRKAVHRGEGTNYVDYSRYVYNNGAYSGSGWNEPSDLGVRYANSAGSSTSTVYMNTQFQGSGSVNTSEGRCMSLRTDSGAGAAVNYAPVLHMAASDTMWQAQGTYGSSGNGTLYFRQGYAGNWGNWLTMISSANIGSQSVNYASTSGTASNLSGFDKTNPSFGAVYASNWFRAYGDCGLYSQDYGGHIRRALTGSYGNWETFGYNRNGWSGFLNLNNYNLNLMMNSSGDHGFYMENGSGWTFFFNRANHCAGIGTDNTWSGDGLRAVKQISAEYGFTTWSDRRAKENISDITSALDKVLQMRGVYFNYIKDNAKVKRVGFIAQELQLVLPEVVNYAEEIDEYNVNYGQVVSVLTEATKEQNDMIVSQAARIEQLELLVQQLINSNNGISN